MTTVEWVVPEGMDAECVELCKAINRLPGLRTIESCCGHGKHGYWIWLTADSVEALMPLNYWVDACHSGLRDWQLVVSTDCSHDPESVKFWLQGPTGDEGYAEASRLAKLLNKNEA